MSALHGSSRGPPPRAPPGARLGLWTSRRWEAEEAAGSSPNGEEEGGRFRRRCAMDGVEVLLLAILEVFWVKEKERS